jgi:hypothetical protein
MRRVYADKSLGYSTEKKFEAPDGFDDCAVMDDVSMDRSGTYNCGSGGIIDDTEEPMEEVDPQEWE